MSKTIMFNSRFWEDSYISNLDPTEKLLFLYFITNPRISLSGIYEIPIRNISLDTGIDKEMIEKILIRFGEDKKIVYKDGWICVLNYPKYQNYNSPFVVKGVDNELKLLPIGLLDFFIREYQYPLDTLYIGLKGKGKEKGKDKDILNEGENFEKFWKAYPRKIAKKKAESIFRRIDPLLFDTIMAGLDKWIKTDQWKKNNGQFIPHPTTWLNQERWNDEIEIKTSIGSKYDNIKSIKAK